MQPLGKDTANSIHSTSTSNGSQGTNTNFNAKAKAKKRKLENNSGENSNPVYCDKKSQLDDTIMEQQGSSAHTPSNGIIKPLSNQMKPGFGRNNHFHQTNKGSSMTGYGPKPTQTKKLVIKNFKGIVVKFLHNVV